VNWDADFAGLPAIELPDGRKLAIAIRAFILALPEVEHAY
jgi:hypothetical protein